MKNLEKLKDTINKNFINKDITIVLTGDITTQFVIKNAIVVMSKDNIFITSSENEEFRICLDYIINTNINHYIILEFESQTITIDY